MEHETNKAEKLKEKYTEYNSRTIDKWVEEGWQWGIPITHEEYLDALKGKYRVFLTPTKPVPEEWLGNLKGKKLLGLASGGGQQIPVFTALGAICTVMDYSKIQIESEYKVAEREGYVIDAVMADMTETFPFENESFDIIFHPVSNCYVEDIDHVFRECERVLKPGGTLLCGLDIGINYIVDEKEERIVRGLPFNPLKNLENREECIEDDSGFQFSHTFSEQIMGQIKAGFKIKEVKDDTNGEGRLHELCIPSFIMTWAVKEEK